MRLLQFEPSELPPPSPHHASAMGPTRMRVRAVWGSKSANQAPAAPHEINLVAQPLAGEHQGSAAGVQLMVGGTTGHGVGRLARPRWPRTSPTIPSSYWTGDIGQVKIILLDKRQVKIHRLLTSCPPFPGDKSC